MFDFLSVTNFGGDIWILILVLAGVTYLTRSGGHIVLSRFVSIHPRVEAALQAVPAAVLTAIVVPTAFTNGVAEFVALLATGLISLRLSPIFAMIFGLLLLVVLRQMNI